MRLLPGSLFGRTALLILAVLFISQASAFALFRYYNADIRAEHLANLLAAQAQVVTDSFNFLDNTERTELAEKMSKGRYIRLQRDVGDEPGNLPDQPILEKLPALLTARLGYPTEVRVQPGSLWIRIHAQHETYWLMLPRREPEHALPWQWVSMGALMALLALLAAFLIAWRINKPLRRLTKAASLVGKGKVPEPLKESGPSEIRTLSHSFNQMAADLRRLDSDRALLLAGISHDLRTPLARLRLGVEMVDDRIDPVLTKGLIQDIEDIDAVVGQFLSFVREDGGEPVEEQGDLNAIVTAVADRYNRLGKRVSLSLTVLPPLRLRPTAMQRLITNLVDNVFRYAGAEVEIRTGLEGPRARLQVLDRGPGIPEQAHARMLQPFTRLDSSRGGGGGTGLGLAIVEKIAAMHGGEVRLIDREGGGLDVQVLLPLTR